LLTLLLMMMGAFMLYVLACIALSAVRREDLRTVGQAAERLPTRFPGRAELMRLAHK